MSTTPRFHCGVTLSICGSHKRLLHKSQRLRLLSSSRNTLMAAVQPIRPTLNSCNLMFPISLSSGLEPHPSWETTWTSLLGPHLFRPPARRPATASILTPTTGASTSNPLLPPSCMLPGRPIATSRLPPMETVLVPLLQFHLHLAPQPFSSREPPFQHARLVSPARATRIFIPRPSAMA